MLHRSALSPAAARPPSFTAPPLELLDEPRFLAALRTAAEHAPHRDGIGLLRVTVRDLGEEALRQALQLECRRGEVVCRRPDGTYAILVLHGGASDMHDLACRIADRTTELAKTLGLGLVQTVSGGARSGAGRPDPDELLQTVEHAFQLVLRHSFASAARAGISSA